MLVVALSIVPYMEHTSCCSHRPRPKPRPGKDGLMDTSYDRDKSRGRGGTPSSELTGGKKRYIISLRKS